MTTTTAPRVSLCKHSFLLQPPHGSILRPSDCERCGTTWLAVQAELERQADAIRMATASRGICRRCSKEQMLFSYQRDAQPWDTPDDEPPVHWLCMTCWSDCRQCEEATGFMALDEAFEHGTDDELVRFVFGAGGTR